MSVPLSAVSIDVFTRLLTNLSDILEKAGAHAEAHKYDAAVLLGSRLYPDMFPLTRQVQLACDFAKGPAARLSGVEIPKFDDTEGTIDELKARIAKTIKFVQSVDREAVEAGATRRINLTLRDRTLELDGLAYLTNVAMPNFYFHLTTAYAILRHNGVAIGKRDFVGA